MTKNQIKNGLVGLLLAFLILVSVWYVASDGQTGRFIDGQLPAQISKVDGSLYDDVFLQTNEYVVGGKVPIIIVLDMQNAVKDGVTAEYDSEFEKKRSSVLDLLGNAFVPTLDLKIGGAVAGHLLYDQILLDRLKNSKSVKSVYLDRKYILALDESRDLTDVLPVYNEVDLYNNKLEGTGVRIAILDTGIDARHPDLDDMDDNPLTIDPKILTFIDTTKCSLIVSGDSCNGVNYGTNIVNQQCITRASGIRSCDDNGHGTHVAGIAAGTGEASSGKYQGIAPSAHLYSIKIAVAAGSGGAVGYESTVAAGFEAALDPNGDGNFEDRADIISFSYGDYCTQQFLQMPVANTIRAAVANGIAVVVSAGNSGPGQQTILHPACMPEVIAVGASCKPGQGGTRCQGSVGEDVASFSSRGPTPFNVIKPDVVAPGVCITSTKATTGLAAQAIYPSQAQACVPLDPFDPEQFGLYYVSISGTSMSAPMVSGVLALLKQERPDLGPDQLKDTLTSTADLLPGFDSNDQGYGRVSALSAYNAVKDLQNVGPSCGNGVCDDTETQESCGSDCVQNLGILPLNVLPGVPGSGTPSVSSSPTVFATADDAIYVMLGYTGVEAGADSPTAVLTAPDGKAMVITRSLVYPLEVLVAKVGFDGRVLFVRDGLAYAGTCAAVDPANVTVIGSLVGSAVDGTWTLRSPISTGLPAGARLEIGGKVFDDVQDIDEPITSVPPAPSEECDGRGTYSGNPIPVKTWNWHEQTKVRYDTFAGSNLQKEEGLQYSKFFAS